MSTLIQFISGIGDAILAAFEFLSSLIKDTLYVAQLAAQAVSSIPEYFSFFPQEILSLIVVLFTLVVVYLILGRQ